MTFGYLIFTLSNVLGLSNDYLVDDKVDVLIERENATVALHNFKKASDLKFETQLTAGEYISLYVKKQATLTKQAAPRPGFYETEQGLCQELNKTIPNLEFAVVGQGDHKRIQQKTLPDKSFIELNNGLDYVLGFKETTIKTSPLTATFKSDLTRGGFAMFVYCDMIEHTMVGDTLAPLLRTCHLQSAPQGASINHIFNPSYYMNCNKTTINTIEIDIRTDSGDPFPLMKTSKLILTLHFRREEDRSDSRSYMSC